jgi:hypothetical protein
MPLTTEQRAKVVEETKSWIGTPYRGWSKLKGCGVDCGQLLIGVYEAAGFFDPGYITTPKDYSLQVAQHREDTEYIETVEKYMREITEAEVLPGDVVVYKLGLAFAHAAIVISWPEYCIHAMARNGVTGAHGIDHPRLRKTERKFYTLKDEFCFASGGVVEPTQPTLVGEHTCELTTELNTDDGEPSDFKRWRLLDEWKSLEKEVD